MKKLTAFLACFLLANSVNALPVVKLNNTELHPFVTAATKYDSNIYLNSQKTSSFISDNSAGLRLYSASDWYNIEAGYRLGLLFYEKDSSRNDAVHHKADATALFSFSDLEKLRLSDTFVYTTDRPNYEITERLKRVQNDFLLSYFGNITGVYGTRIKVSHQYNNYDKRQYRGLDNSIINAQLGLTYNILTNAFLAVDYKFSNYDYSSRITSNSNSHTIEAGLEGIFTRNISGKLFGGVEFRNYDYSVAGLETTYASFVYGLKAQWTTYDYNFIFNAYRQTEESMYGNNRFFTAHHASLATERDIGHITLNAMLSYTNLWYPEKFNGSRRSDKIYGLNAGFIYEFFDWLSIGANYSYRSRNSNTSGFTYADHQIGAQTTLFF